MLPPMARIPPSLKRLAQRALSPVPGRLRKNQIHPEQKDMDRLRASLEENFFAGWRESGRVSPEAHERELREHLHEALELYRRDFIPWLDHACGLRGKRVLEIGCGTGSSVLALAEQGAQVTGIDIDEPSLRVARDRCAIYGVDVRLEHLSADRIAGFGPNAFDVVLFAASLEHMTSAERLAALQGAWHIVPPGGFLAVMDTPNRLWYFDQHTSRLPFYNWLPNDLAFRYARFSPRDNFRELYTEENEADAEVMQHFLRRGRGVSFHEFDLAIKPATRLTVVSSLAGYRGLLRRWLGSPASRRYKAALMAICPGIHEGFFDPSLELVIRRD
jgi:2-polyprenyl-3-methyl-5-hydroxy-6-metoxy-1,4-benzoquinol methylase